MNIKNIDIKNYKKEVNQPLRIVFFSDWRIQPLEWIEDILQDNNPIDLIVYGGDDVARFGDCGINWFERLSKYSIQGVVAILGNDCEEYHAQYITGHNVKNIYIQGKKIEEYGFIGIQGGIIHNGINNIGYTFMKDKDVQRHLKQQITTLGLLYSKTIIVSHTPPYRVLDLAYRFGVKNLGSPALSMFIQQFQPLLVLCGHVHSDGGYIEKIGQTTIINAASDDNKINKYNVALIEISDENVKVKWLHKKCIKYPGIKQKTISILEKQNIKEFEQILFPTNEKFLAANFSKDTIRRLTNYATAHIKQEPVWRLNQKIELPDKFIFFDVETGLYNPITMEPQEPWLIAASIEDSNEVLHWKAPDKDNTQRKKMYKDFLEFVSDCQPATLCSWSGRDFDERMIEYGLLNWRINKNNIILWKKIAKMDILKLMRSNLILPLQSWTLKDVSTWLGWIDTDDERDGFWAGKIYELYCNSKSINIDIFNKLISHCIDDVKKLSLVSA
ncbi:MAG: ribonuclease H-like domain-containing protein [bacterium]